MSKDVFDKKKSEYKRNKLSLESKIVKRKRGEVRDDGMVFWAHHFTCKNGEQWVTKDEYVRKTEFNKKTMAARYKNNPQACRDIANKSHKKRRHIVRAMFKRWYHNNREEILEKNKIKRQSESYKKRVREYQKKRKLRDPLYRLRHLICSSISSGIRSRGFRKKSKTTQILCCSFEELRVHLESQFQPGMSWENQGKWHIDHIMPVSMANTYDEVVRLNHYKNLRPMWAHENIRKSDKTPDTLVLF